jgi:hypothetical protein
VLLPVGLFGSSFLGDQTFTLCNAESGGIAAQSGLKEK